MEEWNQETNQYQFTKYLNAVNGKTWKFVVSYDGSHWLVTVIHNDETIFDDVDFEVPQLIEKALGTITI